MIRDRNLIRYRTHLQQIKLLKRLFPVSIPQLVLRTRFHVIYYVAHTRNHPGGRWSHSSGFVKSCVHVLTHKWGDGAWEMVLGKWKESLTFASPFMRGRLFPIEGFLFLRYRIRLSFGLFDILGWQLIKLVELEGTREITKFHSVAPAARKLKHRAWDWRRFLVTGKRKVNWTDLRRKNLFEGTWTTGSDAGKAAEDIHNGSIQSRRRSYPRTGAPRTFMLITAPRVSVCHRCWHLCPHTTSTGWCCCSLASTFEFSVSGSLGH